MNLKFNTNGNDKQKECVKYWIDKTTTDIVYGGGKGGGKSYLGVNLIFGDAFIYPGTHYFIARKKLNDLRKFTRPSIHEVFNHWGLNENYYRFDGNDNFYELHNGSRVYLIEAKYMPSDPRYYRFGSMQMTRGWIEEAGEFEEEAKNNLAASIGRWKNDDYGIKGKLLQTCNPSKNYLYRSYYKPFRSNELDDWKGFIQALPMDNKMLPDGYIDQLFKTLSSNEIERLIRGNWEYDDDPSALISIDAITDYFKPTHIKQEGEKYMTIDVARKGKDRTVFRVWHGWVCVHRYCIDKSGLKEVVRKAEQLQVKYNIPLSHVIADEDGVGGGVVDFLGCKGFVNGSKPLKERIGEEYITPNYMNLRSQCGYKMAELIEKRLIGEINTEIRVEGETAEEMEQIKQKDIDKDGKIAIVGKEVIKANIGRSPDEWDSIMMRYWFELTPKVFIF